jgi:hypothetical protein
MPDAFEPIFLALRQAAESCSQAAAALQQATVALQRVTDAMRQAHAEDDDLPERVRRLEALVFEHAEQLRALRERLNGGKTS